MPKPLSPKEINLKIELIEILVSFNTATHLTE